ncbi:MAG TPA: hypothetical protein VNN74_11440 [Candidatus Micrarchaeia archaeon]|nr:hypothetical protein [Candidatus Micrarchaeia archaeon]
MDGPGIAAVRLPGPGTGIAAPGLVDLQGNGYAGVDLLASDSDPLMEVGTRLVRAGVPPISQPW